MQCWRMNSSIYSSVTHPSDALFTFLMYLYSVPRVALKGGRFHAAWRVCISAGVMSRSIVPCSESIFTWSPLRATAMGPPSMASGVTWPMMKPWRAAGEAAVGDEGDVVEQAVAGEGAGGGEHFGHAGAAFGAFVADDDDIAFDDLTGFEAAEHVFFGVEDVWRGR